MLLPNYSSAIEANCFFPRPVSFVHLVSRLRKEKSLQLGKNISKVGDLKAFVLATCLARVHPQVTEQQLMRVGGEAFELRRKALSEFRVSDTAESLNIRVALASSMASAEKLWKGRMLKILDKGAVGAFCSDLPLGSFLASLTDAKYAYFRCLQIWKPSANYTLLGDVSRYSCFEKMYVHQLRY